MDRRELVRAYYETIDADEYERLRGLLADDFQQERSDMTLNGADTFVRFMREERPETDTTHAIEAVYESDDGMAVEGVLRRADGSVWFRFVDVFRVETGKLCRLETYTRSPD